MKTIIESIKSNMYEGIDGYEGPNQRVLKQDYIFAYVSEYEDAPEEFEGLEDIINMCQEKGWIDKKEQGFFIPKGTKIKLTDEDRRSGKVFFEIQNGEAKGISFWQYSDFANEIK